jgi:hypothetical protein
MAQYEVYIDDPFTHIATYTPKRKGERVYIHRFNEMTHSSVIRFAKLILKHEWSVNEWESPSGTFFGIEFKLVPNGQGQPHAKRRLFQLLRQGTVWRRKAS